MTAVWFNVLFGDSRDKWDPDLMPDDRVTHFWVDDQDVARWFFDHREEIGFGFHGGGIVWDSFLLFDPDSEWENFPGHLEEFGYTVFADRENLRSGLELIWDRVD